MSTIIAGVFATIAEAEDAQTALHAAAIEDQNVAVFMLNPPGQHALYPIGGDEDADAGASQAHAGAATGAAIGASAGLGVGAVTMAATAAGPIAAIAAVAAGAYAGSLIGALNKLGDSPDGSHAPELTRHAGAMVAINAEDPQKMTDAIAILQAHGAKQIERAEGLWRNGEWVDFDPRTTPDLVDPDSTLDLRSPAGHSTQRPQ